jgi:hypothetical protein
MMKKGMDNALLCIPYNQTNIQKLFEKKIMLRQKRNKRYNEKRYYTTISVICVDHLA